MRRMLFVAALICGAHAHAQVFKCKEGGKTVFKDTPCHADSIPVQMRPATGGYDPVDGMRAQNRAFNSQVELMRIENEREAERQGGMIESERRKRAESERCNQIRKDKADAQYWSREFRHPDNIQRKQDEAKHWSEREFFECQ